LLDSLNGKLTPSTTGGMMKRELRRLAPAMILFTALTGAGCKEQPPAPITTTATPAATPNATPTPLINVSQLPVTLPLLDALFQIDETFSTDLKTRVQLTDEQIAQLKTMARTETGKLREDADPAGETQGSTEAAGIVAAQKIVEIVGEEKGKQLADFTLERWRTGVNDTAQTSATPADAMPASASPTPSVNMSPVPLASPRLPNDLSTPAATSANARPGVSPSPTGGRMAATAAAYGVPADTRVVVNAPAHRMDVFQNGQLIKSYKVGIGYPEFPVPQGERRASSIIFNPTWTPPDEPWVESSNKVKVGQKVAAGDKLNPLGVIKIPIGLPSLIHGGKPPAKIGGFASHGCVGLTNAQVQDFSKHLADLTGTPLTEEQIAAYQKTPTETKTVKLKTPVPVEFRYDTIVVSDGKLYIYRDVYDRDTNTEENLRAVLGAYGLTLEDLTEAERKQALAALTSMDRPASGKAADADLTEAEKEARKKQNIEKQQLTKIVRGQKEVVIPIAALAGKGYPAPVALNAGTTQPAKATPARKAKR
jgi:lipoprotein-anchoring transpeptidase ErfK/SrfK